MRYWPWILALAIYILGEVSLVWWLCDSRETWKATNDTPATQQSWNQWKAAAAKQDGTPGGGPVQRRVSSSTEPPVLVLLRDHFAVVLAAAVVFSTVLYLFALILIRGLRQAQQNERASVEPSDS